WYERAQNTPKTSCSMRHTPLEYIQSIHKKFAQKPSDYCVMLIDNPLKIQQLFFPLYEFNVD
ncbi:MAG: hypothetical protein ACK4SO_03860, partial [Candidatus Kapaibacteriota bacterium]